jgi:valyl-tRNA synthetase
LSNTDSEPNEKPEWISEGDENYLKELNEMIKDVTADMEAYRFYLAAEKLYHYVWHTFADKIIEESKASLQNSDEKIVLSAKYTLHYILETSLKLLHPFMPFITEEIWSHIPADKNKRLLIVTEWPK